MSTQNFYAFNRLLSLNIMKAQAMIIGSKQNPCHMKKSSSVIPSFNIETEDTDLVKQTKYLGLMIDDNLRWDSQVKNKHTKISQAFALLKYAKQYVSLATLNNMY